MTWAEFKKKWSRYQGKESSACQEHFTDLCRLLNYPTPAEADPTGSESFCFQKRVIKDAELFDLEQPDSGDPTERGFADVWKKGCFGWEYKGKKKSLDEAYKQLLRYREALLNPPLLVVCDFDRYIIRTNFNGTVQEIYEFTNDTIDRPENLRILRALFENPDFLKPQRTTPQVTKVLAEKFAEVARSLQKRESSELTDAKTRAEVNVAHRKSLRIAWFLNRLIFCFFAEDTGLLPKKLFSDLAKTALDDPHQFSQALESLFRTMAKGGLFGAHKIRHFNGHLFEESTVFDLNDDERRILAEASEADWQFVEPSIMGTLFARGLDPDQLAALGAQYTSRGDIVTIVEPVLMAPLRRGWAALKASLLPAFKRGQGTPEDRDHVQAFLKKLRKIVVMDPACGSGNFLYVSLQMLLDLEKEVIGLAVSLGDTWSLPMVSPEQLHGIETNPYAHELAQVTVWIGYIQWLRENGFGVPSEPILKPLHNILLMDAILSYDAEGHPVEPEWPEARVIIGNPPFLGDKKMRGELGDAYVEDLRRLYAGRVPGGADFVTFWFERARALIAAGRSGRAGLLATNSIRQQGNRQALERIKESGDIFMAWSDRPWILDGAAVRVSMVGFDNGTEQGKVLDGRPVATIHADLTARTDVTSARPLAENAGLCFLGMMKAGPFDIRAATAQAMLSAPVNPNGRPNSDVVKRRIGGQDVVHLPRDTWIIDFAEMPEGEAALYELPFEYVRLHVRPVREANRRERTRRRWWLFGETRPGLRGKLAPLTRCLVTPEVAKYRVFVWMDTNCVPDHTLHVIAREDAYSFGVVQSHPHELWSLAQGARMGAGNDPRYSSSRTFETYPFPWPPGREPAEDRDARVRAIAGAARELVAKRDAWLNPPGAGADELKKRTLTNLYNQRPTWLELAHKRLDEAVLDAYGWPHDLPDEEILERLLALNLERAGATVS